MKNRFRTGVLLLLITVSLIPGFMKFALSTSLFSDDFETATLNKWTALAGGIGFQISTTFVHGGTYAAEGKSSLGDGMYKDITTLSDVSLVTIYAYYNGSRTNAGDVRIVSLVNTTEGRGVSIKHHLYKSGADKWQLYDEWDGSSADSSSSVTYNTWHKLQLAVTANNNTANLYIDDSFEATLSLELKNQRCNELVLYQDDATTGTYYYRLWFDDVDWSDGLASPSYNVTVVSSPEINVIYTINATPHQTPYNETSLSTGTYFFSALNMSIVIGATTYTFDHWTINGTMNSSVTISFYLAGDTDLVIVYTSVTQYLCRFRSEPSGLFSVHFSAGGSWYWSPQDLNLTSGSQTFLIESSSLTRVVSSSLIYGFDHWSITNSSGTFNSTGSSVNYDLQEDTNITMAYKAIKLQFSASPAIPVYFSSEVYGSNYSVPKTLNWNSGSHTFTCLTHTYSPNSSYLYTFDHWLVNGTDEYGSLGITLSFTADTNLTIAYTGSTLSPSYPFVYVSGALNATWYFRSDTWTVHSILGYKLLTVNTATPTFDERIDTGTKNVSYGVRVWALSLFGNQYELTSGTPAAIVTKTTEGSEMMLGYWTCPAYNSMIDSIKVSLYQRFEEEPWSLRRIYVTGSDLLIRLPSATWTFHYYVNRTVGSTYSTFGFGSYTTYNSRIDLPYYKASPWDVALARLWQRNFVGFFFTPWTYWFGNFFWSILLFGCIIMAWLRLGSFKPILALLWILGGSGSILWALIPATALHVAVIMLALAMAITFFRVVYGKRT